ncbi:MAG TPA: hypothetical protein ENH23_05250 [candidate division Zixibacteria bacterium]|nr:hypothetical protein [candidate division Zixibacteria bacterium]
MGLEIITDELINHLLETAKTVENPRARKKRDSGNERVTYILSDIEGNRFNLYLRQNYKPGMEDAFSCGLSFLLPSGETFTLIRYNGPSHNHPNRLEREKLGYVCHIHRSNKRYLDETGKADGFAEATKRYSTLEGALYCLMEDCNISGLTANPDQAVLF